MPPPPQEPPEDSGAALREWTIHFAGLTIIRQPTEIVTETRRLRNLCKLRPPPAAQWMTTDSALQPIALVIYSNTKSYLQGIDRRVRFLSLGARDWADDQMRRKILIMGLPGAGKTTLAMALARCLMRSCSMPTQFAKIFRAILVSLTKIVSSTRVAWAGCVIG
jgi:predicted AAA+ superfamily ATPase